MRPTPFTDIRQVASLLCEPRLWSERNTLFRLGVWGETVRRTLLTANAPRLPMVTHLLGTGFSNNLFPKKLANHAATLAALAHSLSELN